MLFLESRQTTLFLDSLRSKT